MRDLTYHWLRLYRWEVWFMKCLKFLRWVTRQVKCDLIQWNSVLCFISCFSLNRKSWPVAVSWWNMIVSKGKWWQQTVRHQSPALGIPHLLLPSRKSRRALNCDMTKPRKCTQLVRIFLRFLYGGYICTFVLTKKYFSFIDQTTILFLETVTLNQCFLASQKYFHFLCFYFNL